MWEDLKDPFAEIGEVVWLSAGDEMPINDDGGIFPDGSGIDQIVLDAR